MENLTTRCAISGGGPAGIMLGYLLARAGIDVVVLEKWPDFFRDFRGDTIHPSTMQVLHELGLLEDFLKLPHNEMQKMDVHVGGREIVVADFSRVRARCPYIAFIPQWDFLTFLAQKGKQYPAFRLYMETEATDLIEENGRVVGLRAKNKEGEFEIRADLVVGADGRHSTVREKAKFALEDLGAPIDVLWFHLSRKDDGTKNSLGYLDHGRGIVLLDRDTYWQCGYIIPKGDFERIKAGGIEQLQQDITTLVPHLKEAAAELTSFEQVKLLSVSVDHLNTWYRDGLVCIGDAAHAMSPVGGVGINLAVQDAVAAANILVPAMKKGVPSTDILAKIQKRREFPTRLTQKAQVFMHKHVLAAALKKDAPMRPPWFLRLIAAIPALQMLPARAIGIGVRPEHVQI